MTRRPIEQGLCQRLWQCNHNPLRNRHQDVTYSPIFSHHRLYVGRKGEINIQSFLLMGKKNAPNNDVPCEHAPNPGHAPRAKSRMQAGYGINSLALRSQAADGGLKLGLHLKNLLVIIE